MGECQLAWLREIHKDYAEECARLAATAFTLGFADLTGLGGLFGQRRAQAARRTTSHRWAVETVVRPRLEPPRLDRAIGKFELS